MPAEVIPETPLKPAWANVGKSANQTPVYEDAHANLATSGMLCCTTKIKNSAAREIEVFEGCVRHQEHQQIRFSQNLLKRMKFDSGVIRQVGLASEKVEAGYQQFGGDV